MDSILAKIQLPNKSRGQATPRIKIPEVIKTPDGREFVTRDLLNRQTNKENYNLRSKHRRPIKAQTQQKYFHDDWMWMALNSVEAIMEQYDVTREYATILRSKGRKVFNAFGPHTNE